MRCPIGYTGRKKNEMIKLYMNHGQFFVEKDGEVKRFDNLADAWAFAFKFRLEKEGEKQ